MPVYNSGMNENRFTIAQLAVLIQRALEEAAYDGQSSGRVRPVPDLRTIRYYTTLGLLDPPAEMRGRKAYYGRRHVLQLVAIKRLQSRGLSLVQIQQSIAGADDRSLARWAELPQGFWDDIPGLLPIMAGTPSPDVLLAAPPPEEPRDSCTRARAQFWAAVPVVRAPTEGSTPTGPVPFAAVHVPILPGVDLVLQGVDPAQFDQKTLALLTPALENLAHALRELRLASSAPSQQGDGEPRTPFPPDPGK